MANERGWRGDLGREHREDYETDDLRYRSGSSRGYGRDQNRQPDRGYGQQSGEAFSGGWDQQQRGREGRPGDWFGSEDDTMSGYGGSTAGRGGLGGQMGGQGQSGSRYVGGLGGDYAGRSSSYGSRSGSYGGEGRGYGQGGGSYPNSRQGGSYGGRAYGGSAYGGSGRGGEEGGRGFMDKAGDEVASWFGDDEAERRREMDKHRGRGPRGYQRSDERIKEDVNDRLTDDWMLDASDIDVEVSESEVTLSGEVSSREDKRRAEDITDDVSGVTHVQNNLRVRRSEEKRVTGITV